MSRLGAVTSRLAALLVGLVFVVLLEGALRLVPAWVPPAFTLQLTRVGERALHQVNPAYPRRFFSGVAGDIPLRGIRMTPRPYVEPVSARGLRVLFAGGSTVQGYPHPRRLAAPSFLQAMLSDLHPGRPIEVFNAGITAASSFAVARAVEDGIAALAPQAVVVYTGHNEFYGVYGASSLAQGGSSLWSKRGHYAMMQWRLTRLVGDVVSAFRSPDSGPPLSLLEVMSRAAAVSSADPQRKRAADNLDGNLRAIAAICRERGIVLVLCTLASNETGFAPQRSDPPLDGAAGSRYADLLAAGGRQQVAISALEALAEAEKMWAGGAYLHFMRGYHLEYSGEAIAARAAYTRARELDTRPWRAPDQFNRVVRQVAVDEGVLTADVEKAFVDASPESGVGWELMADHLHPNVAGQALLARVVATALSTAPGVWGAAPSQMLKTDAAYGRLLGDLPVERLAVLRAMAALFSAPPMDQGNETRVLELQRQVEMLWAHLRPGEQRGVENWLAGRGPDMLALNAAESLYSEGDYESAQSYYRAARLEEPFTIWGDLWSTLRWLRCEQLLGYTLGKIEQAALTQMLDRMRFLARAPDFSPSLQAFMKGYAQHMLGERSSALSSLESAADDPKIRRQFFAELLELLVAELLAVNRGADAERYVAEFAADQQQQAYGRALIERIRERQSSR